MISSSLKGDEVSETYSRCWCVQWKSSQYNKQQNSHEKGMKRITAAARDGAQQGTAKTSWRNLETGPSTCETSSLGAPSNERRTTARGKVLKEKQVGEDGDRQAIYRPVLTSLKSWMLYDLLNAERR